VFGWQTLALDWGAVFWTLPGYGDYLEGYHPQLRKQMAEAGAPEGFEDVVATINLFGVRGRQLLAKLGLPEPWQGTIDASLRLIDELEREIGDCERELRRLGADHRYVPLLCTVPGISWVLAYTIAAEIGDIARFPSPRKLAGYSGLCPRVYQSGERDLRGPLSKQGPRYLRWALVEVATHACTHSAYRDRYQQTKARIGKQRGAKVAQIDLARRLSEAIWHMLSRGERFAPKGATDPLAA
jgi:transposase